MNNEEIQSLIEQLKAQGLSEEEIMNTFYQTFLDGKMDRKDLETLAEAMGYELTDDFKNEPAPDPIAMDGAEGAEGASEEDLKDPLNINEDKEDKEPEEEPEEKEEGEEDEPEKEEEEEEDEDKEWEKAQKLFQI